METSQQRLLKNKDKRIRGVIFSGKLDGVQGRTFVPGVILFIAAYCSADVSRMTLST